MAVKPTLEQVEELEEKSLEAVRPYANALFDFGVLLHKNYQGQYPDGLIDTFSETKKVREFLTNIQKNKNFYSALIWSLECLQEESGQRRINKSEMALNYESVLKQIVNGAEVKMSSSEADDLEQTVMFLGCLDGKVQIKKKKDYSFTVKHHPDPACPAMTGGECRC